MTTSTRNRILALIALAATLSLAAGALFAVRAQGTFVDRTVASGLDITINGTDREDWGYGAAFFDYNGDGRLDLYVAAQNGLGNWLFEQNGQGTFADVGAAAGVADLGNGRAVKFADFDNDGDADFFLGNYKGPNRLYRNNGDGTFTNVADSAMSVSSWTFGATWGDFDADGWADLYVVNRRQANQFFHNRGDGTFDERAAELGIDDPKAGLEATWFDYDNDGDVDLYLSQDKLGGNRLWRNNGDGTLTDVSIESGANASINSMGLAVGDYDNDGDLDIYITNTTTCNLCSDVGNVFYRNNGNGTFTNVAQQLNVEVERYGWGTAFFDYDNDGDLDLYVINWSALKPGDPDNPLLREQMTNVFFRNNGNGSFTEVGAQVGIANDGAGYGLAVGDCNDDGFVDLFVANNKWPSVFYENVPTGNRWLKVRLEGFESNRDGFGARVNVHTGSRRQIREMRGGSGYLCHDSPELEIGLGGSQSVDSLVVRWPSGAVDVLRDVAANQTVHLIEGTTVPLTVTMTSARATVDGVRLSWQPSRHAGVDGYRVYRSEGDGGNEVLLTPDPLAASAQEYVDAGVSAGQRYAYTVSALEALEAETRSQTVTVEVPVAESGLAQNYPNPFNPETTIEFMLDATAQVTLSIYDSAGRLVRVLETGERGPGLHEVVWDGTNGRGEAVSSGAYFYRLETPQQTLTRKMMLVK